jgi:hypothetical protein
MPNIMKALFPDQFSLENVDLSEVQELAKKIPSDGHVDLNTAEDLAVQFLRGADRCDEIYTTIIWLVQEKEDYKKKIFSEAVLGRATEKGAKNISEKKIYAEADPEYLEACRQYNKIIAIKKWLENKKQSLVSAHYLMKDILKRGHEGAANFSGRRRQKQNEMSCGEQTWND